MHDDYMHRKESERNINRDRIPCTHTNACMVSAPVRAELFKKLAFVNATLRIVYVAQAPPVSEAVLLMKVFPFDLNVST